MKKDDTYFIEKTLFEIETIISYTKDLTYDEFMKDNKNIDATLFRLEQMIEHIKNLSLEFKNKNNHIPWDKIVGFRNRLVHEYGKTDYTTVYEVISKDIYTLKELFENNL